MVDGFLALGTSSFLSPQHRLQKRVNSTYFRARELCQLLGDPPQLFPTLVGVWLVYYIRGESRKAYELAEQLMNRAQSRNDSTHLLVAHDALGRSSLDMGKLLLARE